VGIRRIRLILVVITLVVLQTSVFTHLRIFDAVPTLLLVATAADAHESGPLSAAVFGFASGLVVDLFLTTPIGLSALSYALTGYAIGIFQAGLIRESRSVAPILGGVAGLVGNVLFILIGGVAGRSELFSAHSIQVLIVASLYDAAVAYAVFPFVRWAARSELGPGWPGR
jgi:rod shape-determining protein MreD